MPDDLDLRALARSLDAREPNRTARVAVRAGKGPTLRRRSRPVGDEQAATAVGDLSLPAGFEILDVGFSDLRTLAEEVVRYGADAIVLDPPELRARALQMLTAVATVGSRTSAGEGADADERVSA